MRDAPRSQPRRPACCLDRSGEATRARWCGVSLGAGWLRRTPAGRGACSTALARAGMGRLTDCVARGDMWRLSDRCRMEDGWDPVGMRLWEGRLAHAELVEECVRFVEELMGRVVIAVGELELCPAQLALSQLAI
jgi:hypothetical protein